MRVRMFRADRHGYTWLSTNPSAAVIRKAIKLSLERGYAVDLRTGRKHER
jgi:hypothetical protein